MPRTAPHRSGNAPPGARRRSRPASVRPTATPTPGCRARRRLAGGPFAGEQLVGADSVGVLVGDRRHDELIGAGRLLQAGAADQATLPWRPDELRVDAIGDEGALLLGPSCGLFASAGPRKRDRRTRPRMPVHPEAVAGPPTLSPSPRLRPTTASAETAMYGSPAASGDGRKAARYPSAALQHRGRAHVVVGGEAQRNCGPPPRRSRCCCCRESRSRRRRPRRERHGLQGPRRSGTRLAREPGSRRFAPHSRATPHSAAKEPSLHGDAGERRSRSMGNLCGMRSPFGAAPAAAACATAGLTPPPAAVCAARGVPSGPSGPAPDRRRGLPADRPRPRSSRPG